MYEPCHSPSENPPEGSGCLPRGCSAHCWWTPSLLEAAHIHTHKQHACMHACIRETEVLQSHKKTNTHCSQISLSKTACLLADKGDNKFMRKIRNWFLHTNHPSRRRFLPFLQKKTNRPASLSYIICPLKTARPSSKVKNPFPHIPRLQKTLGNPKKKQKNPQREQKREKHMDQILGKQNKTNKKRKKERKKKKSTQEKNSD